MADGPGRFVEQQVASAASAGHARSLAQRLWHGHCAVDPELRQRASQLAAAAPALPGRVHGLGSFTDDAALQALSAALPLKLAAALSTKFEWYGCRGAGFHTDAHYDAVLFGAWCLAGPPREIVFARSGLRLPLSIGWMVVFDPFEPHAVLDAAHAGYTREAYQGAPANLFLAFELALTQALRARFGIGPAPAGAYAISSSTAVNAETGTISWMT